MIFRYRMMLAGKIVLLTVVLVIVQGIGAQFLPAQGAGAPTEAAAAAAAQQSPGFLGLVLFLGLLQTVALAYPTLRSRWHGWLLALVLSVVFFGTATFMGQIESLVYLGGKMPEGMQSGLFLMGLFTAVIFSPILVLTLGRWQAVGTGEDSNPRLRLSARGWVCRLAIGAAVMLALYYLFGYYVAWQDPAVRDYYGGTDPGSFIAQMRSVVDGAPWMVPFQTLRGLLWVLLALPVIRMMRGPWWETGLAVALLFTVPSLYLLLPNPLMPEAVRMAHLVETLPYQFLFGWFVVWLFTRDSGRAAVASAARSRT